MPEEKNMNEKINDILTENKVVNRDSLFELKYFTIGREPTTQSKLWRCVQELKDRTDAITSLKIELEEILDDKQLINLAIEKHNIEAKNFGEYSKDLETEQKFAMREHDIIGRKLERKVRVFRIEWQALRDEVKSLEEGCAFFLGAFESLLESEEIKPFDDEDSQKEYWNEKLSQDMNLNMASKKIDIETLRSTLLLSDGAPAKIQTIALLREITSNTADEDAAATWRRWLTEASSGAVSSGASNC